MVKTMPIKRSPMKRSQPRRDWTDAREKVVDENTCRACGAHEGEIRNGEVIRLQACHWADRSYDRRSGYKVLADRIWPGCQFCHPVYDGPASLRGQLRMETVIQAEETEQLIDDLGSLGLAWRRITGAPMPD